MSDILVLPVRTRRERRQFVDFANKIYKGNSNYVPPFFSDEMNIMNPKKNASFENSDVESFLAMRDGKVVGRIMGIISHLYNEKNNAKYARFSRFECIDDSLVAKKLFEEVEAWAKAKGMEFVHGPLGFNDLEREGLMVSGFENNGTYQSSYNPEYYQRLVEENGYKKDCKWLEWRQILLNRPIPERTKRLAKVVEQRYGFKERVFKNKNEVLKKCGKQFFELLDLCFKDLYGTIPFTEKLVAQTIKLFKMILDLDFIVVVENKEGEMIGFGLGYPSIANALKPSGGRLTVPCIIRLLKAIKRPKVAELGLIAVHPDYRKLGVTAVIINNMATRLTNNGVEYCDSGPQLEDNLPAQNALNMFDRVLVREKICYLKKL